MSNKNNKLDPAMQNDPAQKRELLKRLLEVEKQQTKNEKPVAAKARIAIRQRPGNLPFLPLSFSQEALWFVDKLNPGEAGYNTLLPFSLMGKLDREVLYRSLQTLQQRHEVLRTGFVETDAVEESEREEVLLGEGNGQVSAVIHEKLDLPLTEIDLSQEKDTREQVDNLIQGEKEKPFDLSQAPLYRVVLVKLNEAEHRLLLTVHHLVSDGWSTGLLYAEFCKIYQAYARGREVSLEPVVQYLDYAIAQRDYLTRAVVEKQLAYWKDQLFEAPHLDLPRDHARTVVASYQGRSKSRKIPAALSKAIRKLSREQGVTIFVTMLSVFNLLVHRYSGQDDIVIGTPLMTRNIPELENVVGLLINMAVLRLQVPVDTSFRDFLKLNRKMLLDAQDNIDLPFDYLVRELQPHREANVNPFFQVTFAQDMLANPELQQQHGGDSLSIQAQGSSTAVSNKVTRFDIEVYLRDAADEQSIEFIANQQLFDESTVDRMLQHYINLLSAVVAAPDQPIDLLPMLGEPERRQIVSDWNQTSTDYPRDKTVHELFERQAAAIPDAIAIEYQGGSLGYSELNAQANRLAHYLIAAGVKPDAAIVVLMERTPNLVIAQLAVLKAGAAYVAIDPDYPPQRLAFIVEDTQSPVLLTQSDLKDRVADYQGHTLCLDDDDGVLSDQSTQNPMVVVNAENLAYVIYTSGSTGEPKGVEVQHGGLMNLVSWHRHAYEVSPADRATQLAGLGFDASVWELWPYLASGASLYLVSDVSRISPADLWSWMAAQGITLSFLPTPLAEAVLREPIPDDLELRVLLTGGDRLHGGLVNKSLPFRVVNHYGPTENSVVTTCTEVDVCVTEDPPIGRPIDNVQTYILDKELQPVPVGVRGELYIGGASLARGYLNQPELTAEKFIPNPFSDEEGARLYRTGDLVRYRENGQIEFLDRIDHQVKIRGYRIELGEIETALTQQASVSEAVVMVHEDDAGDKRLVAYVVPTRAWQQDHAPDEADDADVEISQHALISGLRQHTRAQLPAYMMPSDFMVLDEFPLNANGKVERKALPLSSGLRSGQGAGYSAPRNETEQQLAQIWADILRLEQVGIHDNFFDLGGHSLKMTQIVSRIRGQMNVELPLVEMFRHLTLAEMAPVVESLLNESNGDKPDVIAVVDRNAELPLSFAQERLWFLDRLQPGNPAYIIPLAMRLEGELHVDALQASLSAIVDRHEALRTRFADNPDGPVQIIDDETRFELKQTDLSSFAPQDLESEILSCLRTEMARPFDLTTGPLIRGSLLRLSAAEHVLSLTMHHIVSDGWSLGLLFGELGKGYAAFSRGEQPALVELPIQYADFAAWQRQWLSGEELDRQQGYWGKQLENLQVLELPTDRSRPALLTYDGAIEVLLLDEVLSERLERLSKDNGVTLFMTLLTVFMAMLHRYSGQDDIALGTPIANRNRSEVEGLIAFFVNMLVMRADCSGHPGFNDLVQRVSEMALGAYAHQDIPFERLVDMLQVDRDQSRNPLFQVQFALQNAPLEAFELPGLTLAPVAAETQVTRFDLECHISDKTDQLRVNFVYNTNLFDATTIRQMQRHFANLLAAVVAEPDKSIDLLPMLGRDERHLLLEQWPQTRTDYPREQTVPALFEQQVAASPDAIALEYEGARLSYTELNERANQLAHYLQAKGVGPEVMVGISVERSLEMVIGLLGILKAGGAYLPLDADYPQSRLDFMLADAEVPVLLTQSSLQAQFESFAGATVCLDSEWPTIAGESTDNPTSDTDANSLMYAIYTSGSTGQPKGTLIEHRSAVRLVKETNYVELGADEVFLQFAPISFDASTLELWGSLLNGARLVVFPAGRSSLEELGRVIENKGVTTLWLTSALFSQMVDNHLQSLSGVRQLLAGGEALSLPHVRKMIEHLGENRLINGYGPTENTTFTCCHVMTRDSQLGQSVPIGRPISNTTVYILDRQMNPVPVGVAGELYIGGDGLARGYLHQPELTAQKFVADPFDDDPTARLYATGDLVRYRADGSIEFIGRIDHQVKVRGYRIELGEIETALTQQDSVSEAAALVRADEAGDKRLVAYVVPTSEWKAQHPRDEKAELDPETGELLHHELIPELRQRLRNLLPAYMVPSLFVVLDEFPLNSNGKLERSALPEPGEQAGAEIGYVAPRTELEEQLVRIWAEVLRLERVGIHDNFFDLGGHSLKMTQVVTRIREQLNFELPLTQMFSHLTVAELAPVVELLLDESSWDEATPIVAVDREGDLPLSFAQERLWFLDKLQPGNPAYIIPLALRLKGELRTDALFASLNAIVARHEALRTRFTNNLSGPVQIIDDEARLEFTQTDLSALAVEEREEEIMSCLRAEKTRPFDLANDTLIRGSLMRLSHEEHVLLLTMHHIISDGWSLGLLFAELGKCYTAFSLGEQPQHAELPIQYADFAAWQRLWLSGARLGKQLEYWSDQLEDLQVLELPTDRTRPAMQTYDGAQESVSIDKELSEKLEQLSNDSGVTLFMTLLTVYMVMLHRYSGQDDIVIGSPIANRNRSEVEGLIAFFVNMLVMRVDCSGNPDFNSLVRRVSEMALGAYEHQDIPFEQLVDVLQVDRDPSRNPLFQVQFALQNAPLEPFELRGLTLEPVAAETQVTRFDLECHVSSIAEGLQIGCAYNTNLFDATTIRRMLRHYANLLSAVVAAPDQPIDLLPMLGEPERRQIVSDWNQTSTDYPRDKTVPELFERQAAAIPDAIAIEYQGGSLGYSELNAQANRLAHYLIAAGVKPDAAIVVLMERTPNLVIAQLAVLKAGAAYVAIDPDYPPQRLAFIVEDTQSPVLLTQSDLKDRVADYQGHTLCLDDDDGVLSDQSTQNPMVVVNAENLAYVIYTSGSTGEPKGVEVQHGGLMNLVSWHRHAYEVSPADRATQLAGLGFDASVWELWPYLASGASLYLVSDVSRISPADLWSWMAAQGITLSFLPTPLAEAVLREPIPDDLELRVLLTGGDRLHGGLVNKSLPFRVVNHYGPTENSVVTTCTEVDVCVTEDPPIGRPIDNVQTYILDKELQPVPVGVRGELYIGGASLARGYLNQPELTAEKFIPNPFSDEEGARLYRTGDLVRYRENGQIEFLDRIDHQVKIRGYRIELGEIETALTQQASVSEAVVMVHEDDAGGKRLVAYVVPTQVWQEQHPLDENDDISYPGTGEPLHHELIPELRQHIRELLPVYMVPSFFVVLDGFPLNANGKLERRALPDPGDAQAGVEVGYVAPRTEPEEQLAGIWAEVLGLERVGIHDNFFDLGGHSLMATQVVSRIHEQLNVELPLAEMFGYPTVAELAPIIGKSNENESGYESIPLVSRDFRLPLSFAQERFWFLCQLDPGSTTYNMPFAFKLSGTLDVDALQSSLCALVERHESMRTAIRSHDGRPYLVIEQNSDFKLVVENLHDLSAAECDAVIQQRNRNEWREGFDLEQAPLFRARLLCVNDQEYVLLVTLHHIIFDGWSFNIFSKDLSALYQQYRSGGEAALTPLKVQFADYSSWLRQWLQGDNLSRQLEFWKKSLSDYEVLNLPTDHARPPFPSYRGKAEGMTVGGELLNKLRSFTRKHDATMYMTMLSAFNVLLHRYSDQKDIIVGSPVAGRNRQDIEGIIGYFANTLVIRTKVSPELNFIDILNRARQASFDAHSHQDIPFEKLVEELHPDRDASRNPLFQVLFNFVDASEYGLSLPEIDVSMLENPLETTKFDLTLCVFDMKDSLQLRIDYSVDLYTAATIQEMLSHFVTLLESIVENPHSEISALPLLSQTQLEEIGRQRNRVEPDILYEPVSADHLNQTIPEVFDEVCGKYGSKPAVITPDNNWSYAELQQISNAAASMLLQSSTEGNEQVALLFPHDAPMLAAIMGVLKAGKTYVPLDPYNPPARLSLILEDSEASVLLVDDSYLALAEQLRENCLAREIPQALEIVSFGACQQLSSAVAFEADLGRTPESITYLLYTSGSTGEPKAVMQNDRNVLHHAATYSDSLHLRAQDRMTLLSSYTFDAAVMDIFAALLVGATLYPVDVRNQSVQEICDRFDEQEITVYHSTPTVYRHILSQMGPAQTLAAFRIVVLGGEPVFRDDVNLYKSHFPRECYLVNGLGPTESTTALQYWMDQDTELSRNSVPVGFAVPGTEVLLLNGSGKPTDILGEIAISSPYVALGYWHQPELSLAKFGTDKDVTATRVFRTGDLGRRRPDGSIEFVGRKDHQIKLRGYRIEAGEVEETLCGFDVVDRAAVVLWGDQEGEEHLIAYIVCKDGVSIDMESLRTYLKTIIPSYMIPASIVKLDDLPMTVGGKLDRRQLPAPEISPVSAEVYTAPTTDTERSLAEIWETVLSVGKVGLHDDFFDLGGHSLMATQVISRIQEVLQVKLPLSVLFTQSSVAEIALLIDAHISESGVSDSIAQIERADVAIDPAHLDELSDKQVAKLLSELAGTAESEL